MEFEEGINIKTTVLIVLVELFILRLGFSRIDYAFFNQVLRPGVIRIGIDQGIVEVENGKVFHWVSCCFKSWRKSGKVMRLPIITA